MPRRSGSRRCRGRRTSPSPAPGFASGTTRSICSLEADTTGRAGAPNAGAGAAFGLASHLAFEVDDLAAACARLDEHGVALVGGPMPRGDGVTQVFFHDPDGHLLELFQRTGEDQSDAPERAPVRS